MNKMNEKFARFAINVGKTVTPFVVTKAVYDKMFNHRIEADKYLLFRLEDFPGMEAKRYTFKSKKNTLVGYVYSIPNRKKPKGIIVFSHGYGGGGHKTYLDLIHAFCSYGYFVFGYDATANDESEGTTIRGFTQGLLDAHAAISFVESLKEYKDMPLVLAGHSWGAFSASNALGLHPRAEGLIAFSGFNGPTTIFKANGERFAGDDANKFMPYVDTYEHLLFGSLANTTAIESFKKNKKAKIVIVHSEDDPTVPIDGGFKLYEKEFKDNRHFLFIKLRNKGHATVYYSTNGKKYYDDFVSIYRGFRKKNSDDGAIQEFVDKTLNRGLYSNLVDQSLIDRCLDFVSRS